MTAELINELRSAATTLRTPTNGWTPAADLAAAELLERAASALEAKATTARGSGNGG